MADLELATRRIRKELSEAKVDQLQGITFGVKTDNLFEWAAEIHGPLDTPYEGGVFKFDISFSRNYPHKPPNITCKTRIYHCNINTHGKICLDVLGKMWTPLMTIRTALLAIQQLLGDPNPDDPLMMSIALEMRNRKKDYEKKARLWTQRYADTK